MTVAFGHKRIAGQREHAFGNRIVRPQFGPHGKWRYSRREFVIAHRSEKPGLTELAGEIRWLSGGGIPHEAMDRAAIMQEVKLAMVILGEADDFVGRIGQLAAFRHAPAIVPKLPDFPGLVIAINVSAFQLRQALATIDITARNRCCLGMRMLDHRWDDRRWPTFAAGTHHVVSLHETPAVIAAAHQKLHTPTRKKSTPPAVMAARQPGDDYFFSAEIDRRRLRVLHLEARDVRTVRQVRLVNVKYEDVAIGQKTGMKRDAVGFA